MPLKCQKYGIYANYLMCIYGGCMPICMSHMKLLSLMMYPESLYTNGNAGQWCQYHWQSTYPVLVTWPNQSKMEVWGMAFLMCYSMQLDLCHLHQLTGRYTPNFWISGEALLPIGFYLKWLKVTIFSLDAILYYPAIFKSLTLKPL